MASHITNFLRIYLFFHHFEGQWYQTFHGKNHRHYCDLNANQVAMLRFLQYVLSYFHNENELTELKRLISGCNVSYSLLVRASYFISCSVYAQSTSVIFIVCKWHWGCGYFLTCRISMPCSEAIGLIIR